MDAGRSGDTLEDTTADQGLICSFMVAPNAFLALEMLRICKFDVVLVSQELKYLNAYELLSLLRSSAYNVPMVLLTSGPTSSVSMHPPKQPKFWFSQAVQKPFTGKELADALLSVINPTNYNTANRHSSMIRIHPINDVIVQYDALLHNTNNHTSKKRSINSVEVAACLPLNISSQSFNDRVSSSPAPELAREKYHLSLHHTISQVSDANNTTRIVSNAKQIVYPVRFAKMKDHGAISSSNKRKAKASPKPSSNMIDNKKKRLTTNCRSSGTTIGGADSTNALLAYQALMQYCGNSHANADLEVDVHSYINNTDDSSITDASEHNHDETELANLEAFAASNSNSYNIKPSMIPESPFAAEEQEGPERVSNMLSSDSLYEGMFASSFDLLVAAAAHRGKTVMEHTNSFDLCQDNE